MLKFATSKSLRSFLKHKSLLEVAAVHTTEGRKTKLYQFGEKTLGGVDFTNSNVQLILNNYTYLGKVNYENTIYPGEHPPIVSEELFNEVQQLLKQNRRERNVSKHQKFRGILSSIFRCSCCNASMCHEYAIKHKYKYRYYICLNAIKRGRGKCPTKSLSATTIEEKCLELVRGLCKDERLEASHWSKLNTEEQTQVLHSLVKTIGYDGEKGKLSIELIHSPKVQTFDLPIYQLKSHVMKTQEIDFNNEPMVRRQLLLAHQIQQKINSGELKDLKQASDWAHINLSRLYQIMNLLYLCPAIQEDIIFRGFHKLSKVSERNIRHISEELDWHKQTSLWQM